jgi:class 3 adenylate cyclase/TolB-like protein/rhodanese-related sulfurtransferase
VVYADMVGYSRLIGLDDEGTLKRLRTLRSALIDPAINEHGGRIVQTGGDSLLIAFDSIDGAVRCAVKIQQQVPIHDCDQPPDRTIRFRVGINIGDVIAEGTDLHGDDVNVAVRLQAECPSGSICVTRAVRDHVRDRLDIAFEELGELSLKNITRPVEAFVLRLGTERPKTVPAAESLASLSIATAPRLSLVVLPFDNVGGNANEDYLADAITEDLTTDLSRLPGLQVISLTSAAAFKTKPTNVEGIGKELAVRYVVEGSIRSLGDVLRVNVKLVSTETNIHLWAGRFEHTRKDPRLGEEEIVSRLKATLGLHIFKAELERSARSGAGSQDTLDLLLRAWLSVLYSPYSFELYQETAMVYEQVLQLNPSSTHTLCALAGVLTDQFVVSGSPDRGNENLIERAASLVSAASAIDPNEERVILRTGGLLRAQGRWIEAIAQFRRLLELHPSADTTYRQLGFCKVAVGEAEEAIPLLQRSVRLDPLSPWNRYAYHRIGQSMLVVGDYATSIDCAQRALATSAGAPVDWCAQCYLLMASAYAFLGSVDLAHRAVTEANHLWPFASVRIMPPALSPRGLPGSAYVTQMHLMQEGLRRSGLRDHAEEDADFGVMPGCSLHRNLVALTPTIVPGAATICTSELVELIARHEPILLDVALDSWGRSIEGAIGLQGTGHGAHFSDSVQKRFNRKIDDLTGGNLSAPIVTLCVNSERFTGYNLALRLVALGYKQVYWYRGGVEAWQVNGLPESNLELQYW